MQEGVTAMGCIMLPLMAVFGVIALAGAAFWIWMLIDCLTKETDEGNNRLIWALVILLTSVIGAAIYYFVRYRERQAALSEESPPSVP